MHDTLRQTVSTRRRETLKLPKRRHHLLAAAMCLGAVILTPVLAAQWLGQAGDAKPSGVVDMPSVPEPRLLTELDREDDSLPDLLAGSVALGENPTSVSSPSVDALGNPTVTVRTATPASQSNAPSSAPLDRALTRPSKFGPIPGRAQNGRTALEAYSRPFPAVNGPTVSLIIGGLGINGSLTQRAITELPPDITLSFAAHSTDLQNWIQRARAAGHEVLLEIPMESNAALSDSAEANRTLRSGDSPQANQDRLHGMMARAQGYAGLVNYQGERFLNRSDAAAAFLTEVEASGLGLITDGSFETPTLSALATSVGVPYQSAFGLIDPTNDRATIDGRLDNLTESALQSRQPIGVGFVYPETLDAVKGWAATLSSDGLTLVPATAGLK